MATHQARKRLAFVGFESLRVNCIVGIRPHERQIKQDLLVDCRVRLDISKCITGDTEEALTHGVSYSDLAKKISAFIVERQFGLLETLAFETISLVHSEWPQVEHVQLRVKKPAAIPDAVALIECDSDSLGISVKSP